MSLTENTPIALELGEFNAIPVAAGIQIFEGGLTFLNSAGYAVKVTTEGNLFLGHAYAEADNRNGAAGEINAITRSRPYLAQVALAGVALTDLGKPVYATADDTLSFSRSGPKVGRVYRYVAANTAVILFEPYDMEELLRAGLVPELAYDDTADFLLLPAWANPGGLIITGVYARITETMGGGDEDQMIVTVYDEDDNALATLTPSDAGADALDDIVMGYSLPAAATGAAMKKVAAGKFVDCKVTQACGGAGAQGKMRVHLEAVPLL